MVSVFPVLALDPTRRPHRPEREPEPRRGPAAAPERWLLCSRCAEPIARASDRSEVHGRHVHTAMNPHGFLYRFGCFRRAPGCLSRSPASTAWTWFEGYAWRVAECRACGDHLGWSFTRPGSRFHGLILDRLVSEDGESAGQSGR